MPRRTNTPLLTPIRAYYVFTQKRAIQEEKELEKKARKRRARARARIEHKQERDMFTERRMNRDIDHIARHPSKLGLSLLRAMLRSRSTPAAIKARTGALILQWTNGDFRDDRRTRRRQQA